MIRVRQVKVNIDDNSLENIKKCTSKKLNIKDEDIHNLKIIKESIDARGEVSYIYEVEIETNLENKLLKNKDVYVPKDESYKFEITGTKQMKERPIIVGSGPAGLFSAYLLSKSGYKPIIIERGEKVEDRVKTIEDFWKTGKLNKNSNVQFGEGGAGTFSDGKLNTLVKDKNYRMKKVFEIFVECGAPSDILYKNKPHIGTDLLRNVIINMRNKIIDMGGTFYYNSCLTDIVINNNKVTEIVINDKEKMKCETLILALGHSARDTFKMLYEKGINMIQKPFAVGVRIEHKQDIINKSQYGKYSKFLPNADYKLTHTCIDGRGVYSFCMCPGGFVVNASSEENHLVINGMSNHKRNEENANSAIVVQVSNKDFGNNIFDGMNFQRHLEEKAYNIGNGLIPVQLFSDYENNTISKEFKSVKPIFKGNYKFANINDIFPEFINNDLKEAINYFNNKIDGFNSGDAIIAGVETRTSSPIRIIRDENGMSNIDGIYPIGEGAGYSGGITTSAMDGIKISELIAKVYKN